MTEIINDKKSIKRKARGLGFFLMGHQLFFNIGSMILLIVLAFALKIVEMKNLESAML